MSTSLHNMSKEELIHKIKDLEEIIDEMKKTFSEEERLKLPWIGNLGQWHWMVKQNHVVFNDKKVTTLGYSISEIPGEIGFEFFTEKLHPDDYQRVMDNMKKHLMNLSEAYEVEYRIQTKDGRYIWYYDRGIVTKRDDDGSPISVSGIVFDISQTKEIEEKLRLNNEKLALLTLKDELTKSFNRRYMTQKITEELARSQRNNSHFSLLMLDIDHFKAINDSLGHAAGDKLLKKFVTFLDNRIRKTDILSRWGGDEFIILLPDTNLQNAIILAKDLKNSQKELIVDAIEDSITFSIGIVSNEAEDDLSSILKRVDDFLYLAKSKGRNKIIYNKKNA